MSEAAKLPGLSCPLSIWRGIKYAVEWHRVSSYGDQTGGLNATTTRVCCPRQQIIYKGHVDSKRAHTRCRTHTSATNSLEINSLLCIAISADSRCGHVCTRRASVARQ
jgi:hypothetical protein